MAAAALIDPLYVLSGFVVGMLVGLTGVGGGSLMTPLLVLLFGIHPATAVGTDLLYAACTKTVGTLVHGAKSTIEWRMVGLLAAGSLPAAALTLYGLVQLGAPSDSVSRLISVVLGIALLLTSLSLVFRSSILRWVTRGRRHEAPRRAASLTVLTGIVLGIVVSISSAGAGAMGVTLLILLYPHLPISRIVGSDIAHAVPLTLVSGLGHWWIGSVNWHVFTSLITGSIPGIVIGSLVATRVSDRFLTPILAGVLLLVGTKLLI
jgi:uncharacterized membrane protein YfcA